MADVDGRRASSYRMNAGGKTFTSEAIVHAKGSMQRPLSPSELEDKFLDCVGDQLADNAKTNTFEKLMNLERLNGASDLLSLQ